MKKSSVTNRSKFPVLLAGIFLIFVMSACSGRVNSAAVSPSLTGLPATEPPTLAPSSTFTPLPTPTRMPTFTPVATETFTPTPTTTSTTVPTEIPTATVSPTYAILRAEVLQRSNCRYGPGAPYLYKYGLVVGSNLEVFGRTDHGDWILVRAIGGDNPCWVKASLMDVKGDVLTVEPTYVPLPQSPYYGPLTGVSAARNGDEVTIFWNPFQLRAGDETASPPYLVEAWVCTDGQLQFTPVGSHETAVTVIDQAGCSEPSRGRVFGVEKHGYTRWVKIPWPQHP